MAGRPAIKRGRKLAKKIVNSVVKRAGYTFSASETLESLEKELAALTALYRYRSQKKERSCLYPVECIIFSMDRALQLHALLSSYFEQVANPVPVHVLYRVSSRRHQQAYEELVSLFSRKDVRFVCQQSPETFRTQTLEILESLQSEKMFFLVDDDLFINPVDIGDFTRGNPYTEVWSLRLGGHLTRSYMVGQDQPLPPPILGVVPEEDKLRWCWKDGKLDWGYPISVDGHLFATDEILSMAKVVPFNSPNTLEANLQVFNVVFLPRYGVSYRQSKIINIPCNKVQQDNKNRFGNIQQDYLLEQWLKGNQIDYRKLYGLRPKSVHEEVSLSFIARGTK